MALEEGSPKTGISTVCNFGVHTDSMILSWGLELLSSLSHCNGYKRARDE